MDYLKEYVKNADPEDLLKSLGKAKVGEGGRVQYEGAYDEIDEVQKEADFIKGYLDRAGITLIQTGSTNDPSMPLISSWSAKNLVQQGRQATLERKNAGDYIPTDASYANDKLEEAKHLPGLETSEDINKLLGHPVTHLTPDVMAKFDETYGKGRWIVKSYGTEAYAGFGIFFPQRAQQIQKDARSTVNSARIELKKHGFGVARDNEGTAYGITDGRRTYHFGTEEFDGIKSELVKRLGRAVASGAHAENGAALPTSPEDTIKNDYGISLIRGADGAPTGITDRDGKQYSFDSPQFKKLEKLDGGAAG